MFPDKFIVTISYPQIPAEAPVQYKAQAKGDELCHRDCQPDQLLTVGQKGDKAKTADQQDTLAQQVNHHGIAAVIQGLHTGGQDHGDHAEGKGDHTGPEADHAELPHLGACIEKGQDEAGDQLQDHHQDTDQDPVSEDRQIHGLLYPVQTLLSVVIGQDGYDPVI